MIKTIFALAYPFACACLFCVVFLFAMITNAIGVSKCGNLWRFSGWWQCCDV